MNRKLTSSRPLRISRHRLECGASPRFRILDGSWLVSKSARTRELSMNRPLVAQICNLLYRRIAFCGHHNSSTGSWSQCTMLKSLEPPMNLDAVPVHRANERIVPRSARTAMSIAPSPSNQQTLQERHIAVGIFWRTARRAIVTCFCLRRGPNSCFLASDRIFNLVQVP